MWASWQQPKRLWSRFLHRHKQWHFQFPVHAVDQGRPSTERKENSEWVYVCVCGCVHAWRRKTWKQKGSHWFYAHKFFSAEFCGVTYKLLSKPCFFFFSIEVTGPNSPDAVPAAEIHLLATWWINQPDGVTCVTFPPLQPHQYNELLVYHMCEMHQRNVTVCVLERVYVFGRGHVYLPSPLFLLLPDWPFVLRHRLCSVYFWGLLQQL